MNYIKIKIKNNYAYLRDGPDHIGEGISVVLIDDELFLTVDGNEAVSVENDLFNIFEKDKIRNGSTYNFEVVEHYPAEDVSNLWVKLRVDLVEPDISKLNYAKELLDYGSYNFEKIIGVYLLEIDGLKYIGQSNDLYRRLGEHLDSLSQGIHVNDFLQDAWDKGFNNISFKILDRLSVRLSPLERQEWLAEKEKAYIKLLSGENIANQTPGEFIPTRDSYIQYINKNLNAEDIILKRRARRLVRYKKLLELLTNKGRYLRAQVDRAEGEIKSLREKRSMLIRIISVFRKVSEEESVILASRDDLNSAYLRNREMIFQINFKISQLKSKRFTEAEVQSMEKLGRQYKEEFSRYKRT